MPLCCIKNVGKILAFSKCFHASETYCSEATQFRNFSSPFRSIRIRAGPRDETTVTLRYAAPHAALRYVKATCLASRSYLGSGFLLSQSWKRSNFRWQEKSFTQCGAYGAPCPRRKLLAGIKAVRHRRTASSSTELHDKHYEAIGESMRPRRPRPVSVCVPHSDGQC